MNFKRRREDNPSSVLPDLPLGAEILVIRLRSIGDVVLTLPAIEALHEWRPDFRISFLVQPFCAALVEGHPAISHVLLLTDFWPTVRMLRRRRFAAVFNMHAGPTSALLTGFSGAPLRVCWARRQYSFVYNVEVPSSFPVDGRVPRHAAEHRAQQFLWAGMPAGNIPPARVYPQADAIAAVERMLAAKGLPSGERYAVLRPGAGDVSKRWPVENFAAIARWLRERYALTPVVNLGPGDEAIATEVRERLAPLSVVVDSLDLRQLMALLAGASLFVGNDTGPTHIAAALAKEMRGDFWNERLRRLVPLENRTPRGGKQVSLRALPARTLCECAGVAVHWHDFGGASARSLRRAAQRSRSADSSTPWLKVIRKADSSLHHPNTRKTGVFWGPRLRSE